MKGRNLFVIGLLVLAAGVGLVIAHQSIHAEGVVVTGGILFICAGILSMAVFLGEKRSPDRRQGAVVSLFSWISSVAAVILGLSMLIFKATFSSLVPFMFGVFVGFASLYQFFLLGYGSRPARLPGWLYIVPTALAACAVYLFMQSAGEGSDPVIMLATGIALGVFGLTSVVEGMIVGRQNHVAKVAARKAVESASADNAGADDADATKTAVPKPMAPDEPSNEDE
ncbi:MAG: hypothetical protein Q4C34_06940 [Bacteroidales bacterium]|nr:hypothetical protein [Bacteroidales bacterium]